MRIHQIVKVIEIKEPPLLTNPAIQQGIRTKEEAANWGDRNRYLTVYWIAKKQRVYAERLSLRVDVAAKSIQKRSAKLVRDAERGGMLVEFALFLLVLAVLYLLGARCGWPW